MQGVMHTYSKSNEISNHDETLPIARRPAHWRGAKPKDWRIPPQV